MNKDDMIYGAHSGVQKAIRRGDLDLAKTCFDLLWGEKKHKSWLKWRLPILVFEEAWQMSGELGEFLASKTESERDWRRFIYQLTLSIKSKDTVALWSLSYNHKKPLEHPEFVTFCEWLNVMNDDPAIIAQDLLEECLAVDGLTEYERAALYLARRRVSMGGMFGDRGFCLAAMLLIAVRGLSKKAVEEDIKLGVKRWRAKVGGRKKPETINLPWYVFDMHTQAGKIAKKIFMKHKAEKYKGLTEEKFHAIWFNMESAYTPVDLLRLWSSGPSGPTSFDSVYWLPLLNMVLRYGRNGPKQVKKVWETSMRKDIKGAVEWILDKRSSK